MRDRQNFVNRSKESRKVQQAPSSSVGVASQSEINLVSLLPRSEAVPPEYMWKLIGKLEEQAKVTESDVKRLHNQIAVGVRRAESGGPDSLQIGSVAGPGDCMQRIQTIISTNH